MSNIEIYWHDDNKKILYFNFVNKWGWNEYFLSIADAVNIARTVDHPIYIISEMKADIPFPPGNAVASLNTGLQRLPENVSHFFTVGPHPLGDLLMNIIQKSGKLDSRIKHVYSIQEALDEIKNLETGL